MNTKNNFSIIIMGDLSLELTSYLSQDSFQQVLDNKIVYENVRSDLAGTAPAMGLACMNHFKEVTVIGKVGLDIWANKIEADLLEKGITFLKIIDQVHPSGLSIYLKSLNKLKTKRILVMQKDTASHFINEEDIVSIKNHFGGNDIFAVDGYQFLRPVAREAAFKAISIAKEMNLIVAFDLVPHNVYEIYGMDFLNQILQFVDVINVEVQTIRSFFGLDSQRVILEYDIALETLYHLRTIYPNKTFFLYFGFENCNQVLIGYPSKEPELINTGYMKQKEVKNFGDFIYSGLLKKYCETRRIESRLL